VNVIQLNLPSQYAASGTGCRGSTCSTLRGRHSEIQIQAKWWVVSSCSWS